MKLLLKDTPVTIQFFEKYPKTYKIEAFTDFDFLIPNKNVYRSAKYKLKMYFKIDMSTQKILPLHITRTARRENTIMIYVDKTALIDIGTTP